MFDPTVKFSLINKLDNRWDSTIKESKIVTTFEKAKQAIISRLENISILQSIGQCLKLMSFCLSILLFICLPLPQFVNDKQGLAIIVMAAAICWLFRKLPFKKENYKANFIDALVLLFLCFNIVSTCSSHYLAASIHGLLKLIVYVVAYFLLSEQLKESSKWQFVFVAILLIGGALVSIDGLYQYKIGVAPLATWEDPNIENQATRIYATFNNPNLLAGFLLPLIMFSGSLLFATWNKGKWLVSVLPAVLTVLLTVALVLTGSRGGYIGAFAGYLGLFFIGIARLWQGKKKRRFFIPVLLLLLSVGAALAFHYMPTFQQRIVSIFAGREHSSNSFRMNVWLSSLKMLKDNWLIGIGVGNQAFRLAYGLYMRSGFDALGTYCVPLEIAVETGIFGLIAAISLVGGLFYRAHLVFWSKTFSFKQPLQQSESSENIFIYKQWLTAGAAVALIAMLSHGLVDTVFFRPQVEFIFVLLAATIVANSQT